MTFQRSCAVFAALLAAACGGNNESTPADAAPTVDEMTGSGAFPGPTNTGVPEGTTLTTYAGPCTISDDATIERVDATGCDAIVIISGVVTIHESRLPRVEATADGQYDVTLTDSTVIAGEWVGGAVWGGNLHVLRANVTGGQHSVHCTGNCSLTDSWLHDQWNPDGESFHNNAFITNGGSNMTVVHNTLHCTPLLNATGGGCTADLSLFGDFDPVANVTVEKNLFKANSSSISYCGYGGYSPSKAFPIATGIKYIDNTFERGDNGTCGVYGPITAFQTSASGNVWSGNAYDDGTVIDPEE